MRMWRAVITLAVWMVIQGIDARETKCVARNFPESPINISSVSGSKVVCITNLTCVTKVTWEIDNVFYQHGVNVSQSNDFDQTDNADEYAILLKSNTQLSTKNQGYINITCWAFNGTSSEQRLFLHKTFRYHWNDYQGEWTYKYNTSHYMFVTDINHTRQESNSACKLKKAQLASIETKDKLDYFNRIMKQVDPPTTHNGQKWWTSGEIHNGSWTWDDKRTPVSPLVTDLKDGFLALTHQHHDWALQSMAPDGIMGYICEKNDSRGVRIPPGTVHDGIPMATRKCMCNSTYSACWDDDITYRNGLCTQTPQSDVTPSLKNLTQTRTNVTNAEFVASQLRELTENSTELVYTDVIYTCHVMQNLARIPGTSHEVADNFVKTANQILAVEEGVLSEAQSIDRDLSGIVTSLEKLLGNVQIGAKNMSRYAESDVVVEVWRFTSLDAMVRGFGSEKSNTSEQTIKNYMDWQEINPNVTEVGLVLSEDVLRIMQNSKDGDSEVRLIFGIYRTPKFFLTPEQLKYWQEVEDGQRDEESSGVRHVDSAVIAASVHGITLSNLQDPINMTFYVEEVKDNYTCAYWNSLANNGLGDFSSDGCHMLTVGEHYIICQCDHLTNFAILFDFEQGESISKADRLALSFISMVGLMTSIVALTLTILTFIVIKSFRDHLKNKVLVSLVIAILCTDVVFIGGIERALDNATGCRAVAALLHYFLLASFAWMLAEGILHYTKLVKVHGSHVERFMLKSSILAWGIPLIPVIVILAVDTDLYRGPEIYCWMDLTPFYYAFLLPVGLIILANTTFYILIIKSITRGLPAGLQSTQSKTTATKIQVRASICIFILLGMTWVFGFFAIEEARLVFQYLFCICNSLQGLLIFLFHVLRDKGVRQAWWSIICCCRRSKPRSKHHGKPETGTGATSSTNQPLLKTRGQKRKMDTKEFELRNRDPISTTSVSS